MEIIGILLIAFASACGALKYFIVKDNDKIVQIAGASAFAAGKFMNLLPCQPKVTVTSCFVYKVIRDLESIYHLCVNPILRIGLIYK